MDSPEVQRLYGRAKARIPGGTQLLSKRPEMFAPEVWPAYFREAQGCEVWDLDGRHYYDFSHNGVGSCLLGYRHPAVNAAVIACIERGSMCSLNAPEELTLADTLCALHPWASRVRFARGGGEACAMAVRIARATTGREKVLVCGYHGWQDWYLAANLGERDALSGHLLPGLAPDGVPGALRGTAYTFAYDDADGFARALQEHGDNLAAIIMEPCRYHDPAPGFLEAVRAGATRCGATLIFDEITIGWRRCLGGAHLTLGVTPDMAVFAKALGNGHPIAAVIGTDGAMAGAEHSFISSTYWTESVGYVAALSTLGVMAETDVCGHVDTIGSAIQSLWTALSEKHGLPVSVGTGYPCLAHFTFEHPDGNLLKTLFTVSMLEKGFLAGTAVYATLGHTAEIVDRYGEAVDGAFGELAGILTRPDGPRAALTTPEAHTGFRRLL